VHRLKGFHPSALTQAPAEGKGAAGGKFEAENYIAGFIAEDIAETVDFGRRWNLHNPSNEMFKNGVHLARPAEILLGRCESSPSLSSILSMCSLILLHPFQLRWALRVQ
jgi:hypothetical protein